MEGWKRGRAIETLALTLAIARSSDGRVCLGVKSEFPGAEPDRQYWFFDPASPDGASELLGQFHDQWKGYAIVMDCVACDWMMSQQKLPL